MAVRSEQGSLSRRQLLIGAGVTGVAGVFGMQAAHPRTLAAQTPGELAVAWNAPPPDFNPLTSVSRAQNQFFYSVFSSLTKADPSTLSMAGDLAESWDVAEDGSSYTFHLRDNAKWHDGEPVTANDVAYTYTMALNPDTSSKLVGRLSLIAGATEYSDKTAETVSGIEVVDDQTVTFTMAFPNGLFLNETILPILPEHILGEIAPAELGTNAFFTSEPVGSGPFTFVEYRADQYVEVAANPDYHFGAPAISTIVYNIIESPDTVQVALSRGEIDYPSFDGGTAQKSLYEFALGDDRYRVDGTQGSAVVGYGWNYRDETLVDPRIHQAFLYAIDRPSLVAAFNSNNGSIFNSFMTHSWYQKPEWAELYPYDPDQAKALLEEAGWDSSRTVNVNVITLANEDIRSMLAAEQQMLAEAGFNIQFQEMELPVWVEKFYDTNDYELVRVTFGVFPDPDGFLSFHMKTDSQNAFGYANPELDARIDEGRQTVDREARIPIYQAINEEMLTALPVAPLYMENTWHVRNRGWIVPLFEDMPIATSIDTIPIAPILLGSDEWLGYHQEAWTKE